MGTLVYDDIPGSWGVYSADWPTITFYNKKDADRAFVACSKERVVAYGNYVRVDLTLRVATELDRSNLLKHLNSPNLLPYAEVVNQDFIARKTQLISQEHLEKIDDLSFEIEKRLGSDPIAKLDKMLIKQEQLIQEIDRLKKLLHKENKNE